jgi:hypothetical protein
MKNAQFFIFHFSFLIAPARPQQPHLRLPLLAGVSGDVGVDWSLCRRCGSAAFPILRWQQARTPANFSWQIELILEGFVFRLGFPRTKPGRQIGLLVSVRSSSTSFFGSEKT